MDAPIELYQSLDRLRGNPDFERFGSWLEQTRNEQIKSLLCAPHELIVQQQGYTLALDDLLTTIRSSRAALERHSEGRSRNT